MRVVLLLAMGVVLALTSALSSAQSPATTDQPIQGLLIGTGPKQKTLLAQYNNSTVVGCGILGVTPSVTETTASVSVSLIAHVGVLPPGEGCADSLVSGTVAIPLPAPLDGRTVNGLQIQGGAFALFPGLRMPMPNLIGLSPHDALLMLSPPPGVPPGQPFVGGPVGLVEHHTHHSHPATLASVVAQRPAAGDAMHRHMTVVLTIAP